MSYWRLKVLWKKMIAPNFPKVVIALVGKYTRLEDAYASVIKALRHAALAAQNKLVIKYVEAANLEETTQKNEPVKYHEAWQQVCSAHGILIPGGFGERGVEGKILAANWARVNQKPFLGICLGFQCAAIEYARHVLGWAEAHSAEVNPTTKRPVIIEMPEHNPGQLGGTMRLGKRATHFNTTSSILRTLYGGVATVEERHRHRYEVNPDYIEELEKAGMKFVGRDDTGKRMEIMELEGHPYYVGVQYHPEYISRPLCPSRPYLGFILASTGKLSGYLSKGCRTSPKGSALSDSDLSDEEVASYVKLGMQGLRIDEPKDKTQVSTAVAPDIAANIKTVEATSSQPQS
jgi:CTP synthase